MDNTPHTAAHPAPAGIDLDKLQAIADRVDARGLFNASCDIREWIEEARQALARKAAQDAPAADEREAFEAWHRSKFATKYSTGQPTRDMHNGIYAESYGPVHQQQMWEAWQASAATAHPIGQVSPAIDQPGDSEIAPADIVIDLREYASNPGYNHNDYADTMRQAANCIESLRARFWNYAGLSQFANGEDAAPKAPQTAPNEPQSVHAQQNAAPAEPFVVLTKAECDIALRWLDVTRLYAFAESEDDELAEKLNLPAAISPSDEKGKADDASAGAQITVPEWVYRSARDLAVSIWRDNHKDTAPQWQPLDDLAGVISQIDNMVAGMRLVAAAGEKHPDDAAVDRFSAAMKAKMAASRAKGRGGWEDPTQCPTERLQAMLVDHLAKGDPVDVGNFAMMLFNRGERTATSAADAKDAERPIPDAECAQGSCARGKGGCRGRCTLSGHKLPIVADVDVAAMAASRTGDEGGQNG